MGLRSDALRDCEVVVRLQTDLVAAQQASVAAAERAEAVEAACQVRRGSVHAQKLAAPVCELADVIASYKDCL